MGEDSVPGVSGNAMGNAMLLTPLRPFKMNDALVPAERCLSLMQVRRQPLQNPQARAACAWQIGLLMLVLLHATIGQAASLTAFRAPAFRPLQMRRTLLFCCLSAAAADFQINLFVTREVRGAVYPVDRWGNQCSGPMPPPPPPPLSPNEAFLQAPPAPPLAPTCGCTGGAARRRKIIGPGAFAPGAASRLATPSNVVSIDTGAFFTGSGKFFAAFGGNASSQIFAEAAYDAYALTYRDLAAGDGPCTLARYLHRARTLEPALPKAVLTNFNASGEKIISPYLEPTGYTLIQLPGGRTLAILALADPTHLRATFPQYADRLLEFWPAVAATLATLRRLTTPPDVIVLVVSAFPSSLDEAALSRAGSMQAADEAALNRLLKDAIGVDIIIVSGEEMAIEEPSVRTNYAGDSVLVVPARWQSHGRTVDNITATFSDNGLLLGGAAGAEAIELDCTYPEDSVTATHMAELYAEMDGLLGVTAGYIGMQLDSAARATAGEADADGNAPPGCTTFPSGVACGCRVAACLQGSFVTDAVQRITGADVVLTNAGAIKATISRVQQNDGYMPVSKGDMIEVLPFANEVVVLRVTGAVLRAALQNGISKLALADAHTNPNGRFPQVSKSLAFDWYFKDGGAQLGPVYIQRGTARTLLNDTSIYTLATNEYLRGGGDGYSMLSDAPHERLGLTDAELVARFLEQHCGACSPFTGIGEGCDAGCSLSPTWASRISQQPDIINIQIGLLCKVGPVGSADVGPAERELCDHMQHIVALLNDKHDGFLDDLLPNAHIEFAEAKIGCIEGLYEDAITQLKAALPSMIFAVGPVCSTDTMAITAPEFRQEHEFTSVVISASSTAPSIGDEAGYVNVARLASSEAFVGRGSALLASRYNWKRIAVVSDDSDWAVEAAQAFIDAHLGMGDSAEIINIDDDLTRHMSVDSFADGSANVEAILTRLQSLDTHVVYLVTQPAITRVILAGAYNTGILHGKGYAWIAAWISEDSLRNSCDAPPCTINSAAVRGAEGLLGLLESKGAGTPMHEAYRTLWLPRSSVEGCSSAASFCDGDGSPSGSPPGYSICAIDSIILAARAIDSNLRDASFRTNADAVYEAIKTLGTTTGVSGDVTLNPSADRLGNFDILNMQITASRRRLASGLPWVGERRVQLELEKVVRRVLGVPLSMSSADFQQVGSWRGDESQPLAVDNVIFPGGVTEVPTDQSPPAASIVLGVMLPLLFVIAISAGLMLWQRRRAKKTIKGLRKELETFKESIVGVRCVTEAFDPRHDEGFTYGIESPKTRTSTGRKFDMATQSAPRRASIARARWYWAEDSGNIDKHDPKSVKQPGNWVSYAGSVCAELDQKYDEWKGGKVPATVEVDLADRIGSTGTEQKANNQHTGVIFNIDLQNMVQQNKTSGFQRKMLREEFAAAVEEEVRVADPADVSVNVLHAGNSRWRKSSVKTLNRLSKAGSDVAVAASKPAEIATEDSLLLFKGQLLQTSKQRPDGWVFGSVVLDVMEERPPIGVDGMSAQAGWFPIAKTSLASPEQLAKLQKKMGGGQGASDALKPPTAWTSVRDPLKTEMIALGDGVEKTKVVGAFMNALGPNIKVQSVQRIQNMSMWQSYAVKRQTVLQREKDSAANAGAASESRYERVWLFHGTDEDTVPKIIEMGFNRSFCGKNATAYGKGVYFARDASYSSSTTYSRPNASGVQHMFLCRIVIGEYCMGKRDALTPDVCKGHQLYDTTVNNMTDPGIYVTYHDAQAYPEYLVKFSQ